MLSDPSLSYCSGSHYERETAHFNMSKGEGRERRQRAGEEPRKHCLVKGSKRKGQEGGDGPFQAPALCEDCSLSFLWVEQLFKSIVIFQIVCPLLSDFLLTPVSHLSSDLGVIPDESGVIR